LRRSFYLDAKFPLRGVLIEISWGSPATGADVWEEAERTDGCEGVGEGDDVAADRYWCGILLLSMIVVVVVEPVDVKDDFVRAL